MLEVLITKRAFWNNGDKLLQRAILRGPAFAYATDGVEETFYTCWKEPLFRKLVPFFDRVVGDTDGYYRIANKCRLLPYLVQHPSKIISPAWISPHNWGEDPYLHGPAFYPDLRMFEFYLPQKIPYSKFSRIGILSGSMRTLFELENSYCIYHDGTKLIKGSVSKLEKMGINIQMKN